MSFVIRTVSRTADGREIVRPVTLAQDSITIGREAANDIHLADLAVEPQHARATSMPGGRLRVESVGGLGFAVDGRVSKRAEIDPAKGAELEFGAHRLTVGSDGSTIIVRVERMAAVSDAAGDKDERTAFSLKGLLPGKRLGAWGFAVLVLIAFLVAPLWSWASYSSAKTRPAGFHADASWSSGPLSKAHASLGDNCQACHDKAFVSVEDAKCVACHTDTHDHADPKRQITAMLPPDFGKTVGNAFKVAFGKPTGQRCVDCHNEHEGAGPMQATAQSFCTDCHTTMDARLPDTKIENAGDFGTAHPQFRPAVVLDTTGAQPRLQRISLDARPIENTGLKFPHDMHLSKSNGGARMAQTMRASQGWGTSLACKDCHTPTADGVRFMPVDMESDCQSCHSLGFEKIGGTVRTLRHGDPAQVVADLRAYYRSTGPARPVAIGGMERRRPGDYATNALRADYAQGVRIYAGGANAAIDAVFTKGGACYDCHVVDRTGDASSNGWRIRKVVQPMRYMMKGWFDHNAHKTETCASCHDASASKNASDVLIPGIGKLGDTGGATCRSCHGGEASTSKVPSSCATCHDYHMDGQAPWRPSGAIRQIAAVAPGRP
jgi:predicted CXXCH cytochrome family protein